MYIWTERDLFNLLPESDNTNIRDLVEKKGKGFTIEKVEIPKANF